MRGHAAQADVSEGAAVLGCRSVVEGIIYRYRYRYRYRIAWRDLPAVFGPWQTVWTWHHRMAVEGIWDKVLAKLTAQADAEVLIDWSLSVDSTIARAHQHATNTTRSTGDGSNYTNLAVEPLDHGIGHSRGRVVDEDSSTR